MKRKLAIILISLTLLLACCGGSGEKCSNCTPGNTPYPTLENVGTWATLEALTGDSE